MASYNCSDSSASAYGEGSYSTCASGSSSIGAPDTGVFGQFVGSGSFTVFIPLIVAIVVVIIATIVLRVQKRAKQATTSASPSPSQDE